MNNFVNDMLHGSPSALRIDALWKVTSLILFHYFQCLFDFDFGSWCNSQEYEAGETKEARFVKDLDRFEMASQGVLAVY